MSLFRELKRRNVIRVAAAYIVIGWLLLQVATTLAPALHLPDWIASALALVLILGFIPVMLFSWAYELTPEGLKKDSEVDQSNSQSTQTGKKLDVVTLVAVAGVIGLIVWQQTNPSSVTEQDQQASEHSTTGKTDKLDSSTSQVDDSSIAVLPFVDLSPNSDQGYFSDGISEEILNVLVRIKGLSVASRTSAFGFKGQEALGIPLIAEKLKVRHVLEGSVRKSGKTVRITAQLIDAKSDIHLWSETFDRQLTAENIFAVQDEIAAAIVKQLGAMLGDENIAKPSVKVATESLDAYELYLKAQGLFHIRSSNNIPEIISLYEQAVAIDPEFAEAWAGLAAAYVVAPSWNIGSRQDYYPQARKAADHATQLDDSLALPYSIRGSLVSDEGDIISALEQIDKAIRRDPKNIQTVYIRATIILDLGYLNQAEAGFRACLEIDPSYEICRRHLSFVLLFQGEIEQANKLFEIGLLKGSATYLHVFENYYAAIGDKRALALLGYFYSMYNNLPAEPWFRLQTDAAYSLDSFNADMRSYMLANGHEADSIEELTLENNQVFTANFLWSPYVLDLRRPEWRDQYSQLRKQKIREYGFLDYWRKFGYPPQCRALSNDDFECDLLKAKN